MSYRNHFKDYDEARAAFFDLMAKAVADDAPLKYVEFTPFKSSETRETEWCVTVRVYEEIEGQIVDGEIKLLEIK